MGAGCSGPRAGRVHFPEKVTLEERRATGVGDENGCLGTWGGPEAGGGLQRSEAARRPLWLG